MKNIYIESEFDSSINLPFFADRKRLLLNYEEYEKYIKGCEHAVRTDKRYTDYIAKIKGSGMVNCAIFGNLKESSKIKMEAHHGPMFTLFDICDIVLRYMFEKDKEDITTFDVADLVLTEHENNNIQVIMLSKGVHKGNHNYLKKKDIFLQIKASVGKIERFIDRYYDGIQPEHFELMDRYITMCKKHENSVDNGLFDTAQSLLSFKKK